MRRLAFLLPIVVLFAVAALFYAGLEQGPPSEIPSPLIGKPAPTVALAALDGQTRGFTRADFLGHPTVVNFWASWCAPCRVEHPLLEALSRQRGFALYGVAYKDDPAKARALLNELGTPFSRIGLDRDGRTGIDWGITGVPETFVIDAAGVVRVHVAGPLTPEILEKTVWPALKSAAAVP